MVMVKPKFISNANDHRLPKSIAQIAIEHSRCMKTPSVQLHPDYNVIARKEYDRLNHAR